MLHILHVGAQLLRDLTLLRPAPYIDLFRSRVVMLFAFSNPSQCFVDDVVVVVGRELVCSDQCV